MQMNIFIDFGNEDCETVSSTSLSQPLEDIGSGTINSNLPRPYFLSVVHILSVRAV